MTRHESLADFLRTWPLERIRSMALEEYTKAGSKETFCFWLEFRLGNLGGIGGGSAFKFGIFNRRDRKVQEDRTGYRYSEDYAWHERHGATPDEAFLRIRGLIVQAIEAIQARDLDAVEAIDLSNVLKWKSAFLFQDFERPLVIMIFKDTSLRWLAARKGVDTRNLAECMKCLVSDRKPGEDWCEYSMDLWREWERERPQALDTGGDDDTEVETMGKETQVARSLNRILYGPPGTGKTFATASLALEILESEVTYPETLEGRHSLMLRYAEYLSQKRIGFVTMHPSFGYESFVEGIRPKLSAPSDELVEEKAENGDSFLRYEIKDGVFKEMCRNALAKPEIREGVVLQGNENFWKMSVGPVNDPGIWNYALENGIVLLGWGEDRNFDSCKTREDIAAVVRDPQLRPLSSLQSQVDFVDKFRNNLKVGDIVLVSEGNHRLRAVVRITGEHQFWPDDGGDYHQARKMEVLIHFKESLPVERILKKTFSQASLYRLDPQRVLDVPRLNALLSPKTVSVSSDAGLPHVLILDEINRANVPSVFGELISLLEPDKRQGEINELKVTLPYSGDYFGVPKNLYVIGTMNTADRSVEAMDVALRRRFDFIEMMPKPELLGSIEDIDLEKMLLAINARLEALVDRDHTIGHAFFMGVTSLDDLKAVFKNKVLPLLQEFFYGDWNRIGLVLGAAFVTRARVSGTALFASGFDHEIDLPDRFDLTPEKSWDAKAFRSIYEA